MADKIDQILTQIFSTHCFQILLNEQIDEFWVDLNLTQQENRNAIVSNPGYSPVQFALLRVIQLMQVALQRQGIQGVSKSQADDIATREYHKILDGSLRHFTFNFVFHVNKGNEEPKTTPEVLRYLRSHGGSDLREKSHVIDLFLEDYYGAPPDLRHKKEPPFNDFFWRLLERPGVEVSNAAAKKRKTRAESSSACPFEQVWQLLVLNEDISKHVFVRDFVPSGLARLMKNDPDGQSVKTSLLQTLRFQGWGTAIDDVTHVRAEPVDSALWWIVLLRSYTEGTGDRTFKENLEVQKALKLILHRYLSVSLDTFPTLLCADGCCMIDSRMGIHGYPIEIQALFYFALRCARGLLEQELHAKELLEQIDKRLTDLRFHIQNYYWLDVAQLNNIYRYKTKEYSSTAAGKFNVVPDSIPAWVFDFMPLRGGYFIGNVSTGRMDFRWFLVGNCIAILSSLATTEQATAIMDLIEVHWEVLIGEMPLKIAYPALEGHEWRVITGSDPKNTAWSYHNGGSWPTLLWLFTAACIKASRLEMAKRAIEQVEQRMSKDNWPEYYDGKVGRYVGKEARKLVPRTVAGYLVAKLMMENPATLHLVSLQN